MGQFVGLNEQQVREQIARYSSDYEYIGGFTDTNGSVILKCSHCGATVKRSMITVRKYKNVRCVECKKKETIEKNKETARRHKELLDFQKRINRRTHYNQLTMKTCEECGSLFFPNHGNMIYCGERCSDKNQSRKKDIRRRAKISDALVDKDISLQRLYDRDGGVCWLCGEQCDFEDARYVDGIFIAGNRYPSIDHVVALANGGKHSWENVKLAHRICNSIKSDNFLSTPASFFDFKNF